MTTSSLQSAQAVLFDLDGTLVDTAPDMIGALNLLLQEEGLPAADSVLARKKITLGTAALLELGFGILPDHADYPHLSQRFLNLYEQNICVDSRLYKGAAELLDFLDEHSMCWGVVTNKSAFLTVPLLEALQLSKRACSVVSGDDLSDRKPHPAPLYHAASQCGLLATQCIYVGDAARDIEAGNRAGMVTLLASYGYIDDIDTPDQWGANGIIQQLDEVIDWLQPSIEETGSQTTH